MNREIIQPDNREHWLKLRSQDLTSTQIPALFNCSPYMTKFQLWHRVKSGEIEILEPNERMLWGTRLEGSIAHGIAEDEGLTVTRMTEYIRLPDHRIGASFDYKILAPMIALMEIKNVDALVFKKEWIDDEEDTSEAPPHIEIQAQVQQLVSGIDRTLIGALRGGNSVAKIWRDKNPAIHAAILRESALFWKSIDENNPPPPDFALDSDFISSLYGHAEPGKVYDGRNDGELMMLAMEYKRAADALKEAQSQKDAAKAEILTKIKDSEKAFGDGFNISAGLVGPARIEYDREGYRNFRVTWPKKQGK